MPIVFWCRLNLKYCLKQVDPQIGDVWTILGSLAPCHKPNPSIQYSIISSIFYLILSILYFLLILSSIFYILSIYYIFYSLFYSSILQTPWPTPPPAAWVSAPICWANLPWSWSREQILRTCWPLGAWPNWLGLSSAARPLKRSWQLKPKGSSDLFRDCRKPIQKGWTHITTSRTAHLTSNE